MRGHCRLCRRCENLRRSHIISRFALRDAQGNAGSALLRVSSDAAPRLPRDQSWDVEYLLCAHCEGLRSDWERIVAATVAGRGDGRGGRPSFFLDEEHPGQLVQAKHLRYGPVKLWVLSTILLMHHAQKPDWVNVSLTPDEDHRLRARVHAGDPGSDLDFQILGRITVRSSPLAREGLGGVIVPGHITEWSSGKARTRFAHFSALDCQWSVLLGDWPDNPMRDARLRRDGTWRVLRDTDFDELARAASALNLVL